MSILKNTIHYANNNVAKAELTTPGVKIKRERRKSKI